MLILNQTYAKGIEMRRIRMLFTYTECVNKIGDTNATSIVGCTESLLPVDEQECDMSDV